MVSDISESICDVSDSIALGEVSGGNCGALLFRGDRFLDISCAIFDEMLGDVVDVMFMYGLVVIQPSQFSNIM